MNRVHRHEKKKIATVCLRISISVWIYCILLTKLIICRKMVSVCDSPVYQFRFNKMVFYSRNIHSVNDFPCNRIWLLARLHLNGSYFCCGDSDNGLSSHKIYFCLIQPILCVQKFHRTPILINKGTLYIFNYNYHYNLPTEKRVKWISMSSFPSNRIFNES